MNRLYLWLRARLSTASIVIHVRPGRAHCVRGQVTAALLGALGELAREHDITEGVIEVSRGAMGAMLNFTGDIPAHMEQRVRNLWFAHSDGLRL